MKKIAILMAAIVLGSLSAMAQGNIAFTDQGSTEKIYISTNGGSTSNLIGQGLSGIGAGPGQVNFRLYVQTNGVAVNFNADGTPVNMFLVGTTTNLGSTSTGANGLFNGGFPLALNSPWDGTFPIEFYYWAQTQNGLYTGHSSLGTAYTLTTGATPANSTFGIGAGLVPGFSLLAPVPEPGTILLGGLGAAGLLLFRRRKS